MLSRCWSVLSTYLVFMNLLFAGVGVLAKEGDKISIKMGNSTIERTVQLRTHSLHPPYIDQDLQNRWWDFGADAYVNTMKHIRLTRDKPSQIGWLWSRLALTATNWVIEAEFKVGSGDSSNHLYGDGLAMWITGDRAQSGPVHGNKDYFNGVGIILDTYSNGRHNYAFPRVTGVRLDGQTKYDYDNDGKSQALGACSANFRLTNVATKLKVTYIKDEFLDVKIQYRAWDEWVDCFNLPKVAIPPNPFIGFSAQTGDVSDAHDIISVTTYSAILSPADRPLNQINQKKGWGGILNKKTDDPTSQSSGTWLGFFFKLALFAGVCAGGWYGYKEYQKRQRFSGFGNFGGPSSARSFASPSTAGFGSSYTPSTAGFGNGPNTSGPFGGLNAPYSAGPSSAYSAGPNSAYSAPPSAGYGPPNVGFGSAGPASPAYSSYAESKRY